MFVPRPHSASSSPSKLSSSASWGSHSGFEAPNKLGNETAAMLLGGWPAPAQLFSLWCVFGRASRSRTLLGVASTECSELWRAPFGRLEGGSPPNPPVVLARERLAAVVAAPGPRWADPEDDSELVAPYDVMEVKRGRMYEARLCDGVGTGVGGGDGLRGGGNQRCNACLARSGVT